MSNYFLDRIINVINKDSMTDELWEFVIKHEKIYYSTGNIKRELDYPRQYKEWLKLNKNA